MFRNAQGLSLTYIYNVGRKEYWYKNISNCQLDKDTLKWETNYL